MAREVTYFQGAFFHDSQICVSFFAHVRYELRRFPFAVPIWATIIDLLAIVPTFPIV